MSATTVIAVYAAGIATAGIGWQIFVWWRATRTNIRVHAFGDIRLTHPRNVVTAVRVVVINDSPFDVAIHRVLLMSRGEAEMLWLADGGDQDLPRTLPGRARAEFAFAMDDDALFADQPVVARTWTATGQEFRSPLQALDAPPDSL